MNLNKALSRITALALSVALLLTQTGITAYGSEGAGLGASGTEKAEGGDLALGISAAGGIMPASFGVYNAGDVAIINGIIDSQPGLGMTRWDSGPTPPSDWSGLVEWSSTATDRRVEELWWGGIGLTGSLNVSGLSGLQYLDCSINQLTSLNVTGLSNLQLLDCSFNQLTSLNVSGLLNLLGLGCSNNQLTDLNVTGLSSLQILACGINQLTDLNVTGLDALELLGCNGNQLTDLNVTGLSNLAGLHCFDNQLTSLNVTGLLNLQYLDCEGNQLTSLDVSSLSSLVDLYCKDNPLLDFTLMNGHTVKVNVAPGYSVWLDDYGHATGYFEYTAEDGPGGNSFSQWQLDSGAIAIGTPANPTLTFTMPAGNVEITALFTSGAYNAGDIAVINGIIDSQPGLSMDRWDIGNNPPSSWSSVHWSTTGTDDRVTELYWNGENLTGSLDVTYLPNLQRLDCDNNQLTGLDVTGLSDLEVLYCSNNQLTGLNVSTLSSLTNLACDNNPLLDLTLQDGRTVSVTVDGGGSVMLTDYVHASTPTIWYQATPDAGFGFAGWESSDLSISDSVNTHLDFIMPASGNVGITAVFGAEYNQGDVDAINAIIDAHPELGMTKWTSGPTPPSDWNNYVGWSSTAADRRVQGLHWQNKNLTGSLDVTGLPNLEYLYCYDNQLTGLNVTGLSNLLLLNCNNNQLTGLSLSNLPNLEVLYCFDNHLTDLSLSNLPNLRELACFDNQLTGLNVTGLGNLLSLSCSGNQLTDLDVSTLSSLIYFECYDNPLGRFTLQDGRTVSVAVSGSGSILLTGYSHDTATPVLRYQAIPEAGTEFSRWEGSGIQIDNPTNHVLDFTMPTGGNVNLTAVFSTGGATDTLTLGALSDDTVTIGYNYRKSVSYSYSGSGAVSFQVTGLPAGLAFDSATGTISGVPTDAAGQYPVQVTVRAGGLSDSGGYTLTLTTTATAASLTMEPLADETVAAGNPYTRLPAYTYIGPDTLAFSATGLPTGLSIDSATGRISGTPTVAGAYDITVTVREETGSLSASQGYRLTVTGGGSSGSSSSGRSSSSGSSSGGSTPDSRVAKTQLPASAFSWDGGRTLTIDHSGITPLGLLSVRWDGETLTRGTDYAVYQGSVIIRFSEDFIAAQSPGAHTVRVEFANHTGEYTLSLGGAAAGSTGGTEQTGPNGDTHNPQTGDFGASPWWWMMALLPAAALTFGSAALIWRRLRQAKEV